MRRASHRFWAPAVLPSLGYGVAPRSPSILAAPKLVLSFGSVARMTGFGTQCSAMTPWEPLCGSPVQLFSLFWGAGAMVREVYAATNGGCRVVVPGALGKAAGTGTAGQTGQCGQGADRRCHSGFCRHDGGWLRTGRGEFLLGPKPRNGWGQQPADAAGPVFDGRRHYPRLGHRRYPSSTAYRNEELGRGPSAGQR